ncbi:MAG TPA: TldD/PmbA family protein [Vicinamibacteria bacterium]|nr:TldD/PmbA family protein [Vicinamibacteria bacterium]
MAASRELFDVAQRCIDLARAQGAAEVAARAYKTRDVTVQWRDGKLEQINEATTRGASLQLYVDGRYSAAQSSDLRPDALARFVADAVAMTRSLAPDPHRSLPDPSLYGNRPAADLQIDDPAYAGVSPEKRRAVAQALEAGARGVKGADAILSVTGGVNDTRSETVRVHSNGFRGERVDTQFWSYASVSVKDADGRRPEDGAYAGVRFVGELPEAETVGRLSAERAIARLGAKKAASAQLPMVLENRTAGRLAGFLGQPLSARALQQKQSFLEGKLGQAVGSEKMTVTDDPLLPRGFGSRHFDAEGISARRLPIFEKGVLRNCYVDTYYGKKLGMAPTTGSTSNLAWAKGDKDRDGLIAEVQDGILVTGFIGGNSNATTGDFSLGVQGFRIRGGKLAEAVAEMNIAGNHLELWKRLSAVGNDPYPYSPLRTPTLVFDGVQFAGL